MATLFDNRLFNILNPDTSLEPGALLWWYIAGGTTLADTYTTSALDVENSNPVVADGEARFPAIWLTPGANLKYILTAADSTPADPIVTQDNYAVPAAAPSYDPDLADFLAGDAPLPLENGGTNSTSAVDALDTLGAMPQAGGAFGGQITLTGKGGYIHNSISGMASGEVFLQATGSPPTMANGDWLAEY